MKEQISFLKKLKSLGVLKFKNSDFCVLFKDESILSKDRTENTSETVIQPLESDDLPDYVKQIVGD